ncbi:hypothetical protein WJX73_000101 [Symbiochloris irregularis]|uniref:Uncharacterized protein n=1 Tax=Symbiochloris irregularis TaxID=706552 RepID=A0AAW1NZ17_9CHLO
MIALPTRESLLTAGAGGKLQTREAQLCRKDDLFQAEQKARADISQLLAKSGLPLLEIYPPYLHSFIQAIAELRSGEECSLLEDIPGHIKDFRQNLSKLGQRIEDQSSEPHVLALARAEMKAAVALKRTAVAAALQTVLRSHQDLLAHLQLSMQQVAGFAEMAINLFAQLRAMNAEDNTEAYGICMARCQLQMSNEEWLNDVQFLRWQTWRGGCNLHPVLLVVMSKHAQEQQAP